MKISRKWGIFAAVSVIICLISSLAFIYRPQWAINLHYLGREDPFSYHIKKQGTLKFIDEQIPPDSIIFLGDSLTERLPINQLGANVYNFGISADTINDLTERVEQYHSLKTARLIILEIGTNDDNSFHEEDLTKLFAKLPDVPLLWYAAPPKDKKIVVSTDIEAINKKASELCSTRPNCQFVDLKSDFADNAGNLKFHIGDGVHLNEEANSIWLADLKKRIEQIQ